MMNLKNIFSTMDADQSGAICAEEIEDFMSTEKGMDVFRAVGLATASARRLMEVLDIDGSGEISINEFCDGIVKLTGPLTHYDIHLLMMQNEKMFDVFLKTFVRILQNNSNSSRF